MFESKASDAQVTAKFQKHISEKSLKFNLFSAKPSFIDNKSNHAMKLSDGFRGNQLPNKV